MRVAAAVTVESGAGEAVRNLRHESRVSGALRRIEAEPEEPVTKDSGSVPTLATCPLGCTVRLNWLFAKTRGAA